MSSIGAKLTPEEVTIAIVENAEHDLTLIEEDRTYNEQTSHALRNNTECPPFDRNASSARLAAYERVDTSIQAVRFLLRDGRLRMEQLPPIVKQAVDEYPQNV